MSRTGRWPVRAPDLGTRLLVAILVVVVVGGATEWVVVAGVGPAIFVDHMSRTAGSAADTTVHAEAAFRSASVVSLAIAFAAALLASVAVSLFLTRRISRMLSPATDAAHRVAHGDYAARVPSVGMGTEFDDLAEAFNTMASDLGRVEVTRTQMLGDLAHEMRTPVTTLGAYLEAIGDGVEQADAATLTMLRDQVGRLARLSEDIALVSTAEEGRLTLRRRPVGVARILADGTAQAAARYASSGVALQIDMTPDASTAMVDADTDRMAQVLTNLLDNALRHSRPGGSVLVRADSSRGMAQLAVVDDGEGIAAEHLPHVFDRFYRADAGRDRAHGGSGLGLAIAKAITKAHQGLITVHSDGPGCGTTFTVMLPLSKAAATAG